MPAHTFNLADLFESIVDVAAERTALVAGDARFTFAELEARANRLAHHLAKEGVGPGDHVGLYLYNGHEFLEAVLAALKLRAVPININYRYVADELRYLCKNADLKALFYQPELESRVDAIVADVPTLRYRVAVGPAYEAALAASTPERRFSPRSNDDHYVVYTGGTTGMPRGVVWRHRDVFYAGLQGGNVGGDPFQRPEEVAELAASGDKALTFMPAAPFIHGTAQWAAFICWMGGGKAVVNTGPSFDAHAACQLIEREQVNTLILVGDAMARPLADAIAGKPRDLSSLAVIASAGAILSRTVREELEQRIPGVMILNNFGATETGHQGRAIPEEGQGRPRFMMDETTAVLDEELRRLAPGSTVVGKLARTGHIPLGYYRDPEKTAATFVTVDGVRWVIPGDHATIDAEGFITVLGRGAVSINTGGEKVYPEEVEEALKAHPSVLDAVVVGVPDARWGERVTALVLPRPGQRPTLEELSPSLRERIAGYKLPRELHLVESLERQPSGKPDYRWAKAEAQARATGAQAAQGGQGSPSNHNHSDGNGHANGNGQPHNDPARVQYWHVDELALAPAWKARRRLAAAVHALIDQCVLVDDEQADAAAIDAFAADAEALAARLGELPRKGGRDGFLDGTYYKDQSRYMDRGPLIGRVNPISPPMVLSSEGGRARATVTFGAPFEGVPGFVHGGFVAAAFDQLFGYLSVLAGVPGLTGSLTVKYRRPTPLHTELRLEAEVQRSEGRKTFVVGKILAGDQLCAEAEALFVTIDAAWLKSVTEARP